MKLNPANQPDKIFLSSDDPLDTPSGFSTSGHVSLANTSYHTFTVNLKQPVLNCAGIQLGTFVQANTPGDGPCISDYEASRIGFLYYKQASSLTAPNPDTTELRQIYLLASSSLVLDPTENWTNRYFSSYADLVSALNNASTALGAGPSGGADVVFIYDQVNRRICWYGTDNTKLYMPAGYNDPQAQGWIKYTLSDLSPLPYGKTLNQRLGFTNQSYNFDYQRMGGTTSASYIYANGFPNLVRTNSITLRTSFHSQSSVNSKDNRDVLAVIPQQVPFLGVNDFQCNTTHFLRNIPETLQSLTVSMLDDAGQPYWVDNNVNTLIELLCNY